VIFARRGSATSQRVLNVSTPQEAARLAFIFLDRIRNVVARQITIYLSTWKRDAHHALRFAPKR
jgi:hypothetical protein